MEARGSGDMQIVHVVNMDIQVLLFCSCLLLTHDTCYLRTTRKRLQLAPSFFMNSCREFVRAKT